MKPLLSNTVEELDMLGIQFPQSQNGTDAIRRNYVANMQHFSDTYKDMQLEGNFDTEQLLILQVGEDDYIQGYADLIQHNDDGSISILDWKTSSMYVGDKLEHAAHQLRIYAMAKEAEGETIDKLCWIFLKYVNVSFWGYEKYNSKNKTMIEKTIERRKIGKDLAKYVKRAMLKAGYDNIDTDVTVDQFQATNDFSVLPEDIRKDYEVKLCIVEAGYTPEDKQKTIDWIDYVIDDFKRRQNENDWPPRRFKTLDRYGNVKDDVFFCRSICEYRENCKHIAEFNELKTPKRDPIDDLF